MTTMRTTKSLLLAAAAGFAAAAAQDPQPAPAAGQVAAATPAAGTPKPHALEGVYRLKKRVLDGQDGALPSRGYLAITKRHLFLCVAAEGARPDLPLVRAGVREWRDGRDGLRTTVELEYYTDGDGDVHFEKRGDHQLRRIELVQGGVRVVQSERSWLEFERVE